MFKTLLSSRFTLCQSCRIRFVPHNDDINRHVVPFLLRHFHQNSKQSANDGSFPKGMAWYKYAVGVGLTTAALITLNYNDSCNLISTVQAASPVAPATTSQTLRNRYNFIADIVEKVSPAVVHIQCKTHFRQGAGSGFIIQENGLIVTNAHVVASARHGKVEVELTNGKRYTGEVQVVDNPSDLALVKINDTKLPTIKLANSESVRPGEWVVAVGSPLTLSNTVTSGIISSVGRKLGLSNDIDYIQTDAHITFGNSGGPLINLDGEAVGVNSMKVAEGISFAIPSDYVKDFLTKAEKFKIEKERQKKSVPPYMGISMITLTPHVAATLRNRVDLRDLGIDRGIFVVNVYAGSPAHRAGISPYDVVMKIDGTDIDGYEDWANAIRDKPEVKLTIYRHGGIINLSVKL